MAINKRKDAAALFELIDKSTLKVPKNAGALKIPSWWSSKTNPPAQPTPNADAELTDSAIAKATPVAKPAAAPGAGQAASQHRLFEPPPANADTTVSPSIRPPAPASAPRPQAASD